MALRWRSHWQKAICALEVARILRDRSDRAWSKRSLCAVWKLGVRPYLTLWNAAAHGRVRRFPICLDRSHEHGSLPHDICPFGVLVTSSSLVQGLRDIKEAGRAMAKEVVRRRMAAACEKLYAVASSR